MPAPLAVDDEDRGSITLDVDAAIDDLLAIDVEFAFDLSGWRNATAGRIVLGNSRGVRSLRFHDSLTPPSGPRFFVRFSAPADGEK